MDMKVVQVMRNARKPVELNVKPGYNVLIVADTQTEPLVYQALAAACVEVGGEPTIAIMTPREFHQAEPTAPVAEAMLKSDVNILIPSKSILHSKAGHAAMKAGHPCIASEELSVDMLTRGASTADYRVMQEVGMQLLDIFNNGSFCRVTSDQGTDLSAQIGQGRKGWCVAGTIAKQEGMDLFCCAFPDGEVGVVPLEGTSNGTVVWDTSMHFAGVLREPVKAIIRDGLCVDIQGGKEAEIIRRALADYGDENSLNFAEIAVGINPNARITGVMREDKKLLGAVHMALGNSSDTGGLVWSKTHMDGCVRYPNVWIDDQLIVEKGKLVFLAKKAAGGK